MKESFRAWPHSGVWSAQASAHMQGALEISEPAIRCVAEKEDTVRRGLWPDAERKRRAVFAKLHGRLPYDRVGHIGSAVQAQVGIFASDAGRFLQDLAGGRWFLRLAAFCLGVRRLGFFQGGLCPRLVFRRLLKALRGGSGPVAGFIGI